jgi:hypothetical protein
MPNYTCCTYNPDSKSQVDHRVELRLTHLDRGGVQVDLDRRPYKFGPLSLMSDLVAVSFR